MPESTDADDVCRLLASGANIVSTRAEFFNPAKMDPGLRARVEAACREGNSSIHSTGSSPGFITEALPIVLTSLSRRLDLVMIDEFANCIDGCSEDMLVNMMGFGETPESSPGASSASATRCSSTRWRWSPMRSACRSSVSR